MKPQMMIKIAAAYMMASAVIWSAGVWLLELPSPLGTQTWTTWLGGPILVLVCASFISYLLVTYHSTGLLFTKIWMLCNVCLSGYSLFMTFNDLMLAGGCLAILLGSLWFLKELERPEMKGAYTAISALHKQMWNALSGQQ
ncbi:hypothetical protein KS670_004729 [Vibrio parahaemolyticus]|nr:hypothetical protein [Vibrio parahaemolyticus]EHR0229117.1 hypothetical protein [Vibrio parahaemolyticus]EIU6822267.1 hypothetical protein [Vibrio parahaemolyticus]